MTHSGAGKPHLSFGRILQMNLGFLGLQFSFGLQQSNMGPIYSYLGADEGSMPLLWLAGPMTGLIVQPLIGAMSDRTATRLGRRTPYFLVGAVLCSLCLLAMPYSRALWIAAALLWVLDAANNVTMEPYRAYVSDRLDAHQRPLGFLTQSAFTGLAQTLSYLAPSLLVWWGVNKDLLDANGIPQITRIAFLIGAVLSIATIVWSVWRVPELPLRRDGKVVSDLDVYEFLVQGDKSKDVQLAAGDVIVFQPAGARVALNGALDTPAIYELKAPQEPVREVLRYAGGTPLLANPNQAQLERVDTTQPKAARFVEEFKLDGNGLQKPLRDGDILTLLAISPQFANAVTLRGQVAQPDRKSVV